ncbi:MAG: AmmeMemoRadiSam system protein B [Deltaproteobacteria bacterium]|nr:AmmeMemoRadiSam system protein B [Deltaproteobacteria bacterium]
MALDTNRLAYSSNSGYIRLLLQTLPVFLTGIICLTCAYADDGTQPFPSFYSNAAMFRMAIETAQNKTSPPTCRITGLTVPHHLLARDLISVGFAHLAGQKYDRIVIISPDHFHRGGKTFSVPRRDFETVFGLVRTDQAMALQLVRPNCGRSAENGRDTPIGRPAVSFSNLFSHEHGVQALLPFVKFFFPETPVLPIAVKNSATRDECEALLDSLIPLLSPATLIIQSTDFSHYLPMGEAQTRDQETLRILSAEDPALVFGLTEPAHLDSRAAQYLQLRIQRQFFCARINFLAHGNSQNYTSEPVKETTSYFVELFVPTRDDAAVSSRPNSSENFTPSRMKRFFFAGDTFFGRFVAEKFRDEKKRRSFITQALKITGGCPMIVNLEGVVREACPHGENSYRLCMEQSATLSMLKDLNVMAVSLANNHSHDFGDRGYAEMRDRLIRQNFYVLENGMMTDFDLFRLAAFTDVDNRGEMKYGIMSPADLGILGAGCSKRNESVKGNPPTEQRKAKPVFAFLHFGHEFSPPAEREKAIVAALHACGVETIFGAHSHRPEKLTCDLHSCRTFSLGNFIFDQIDPRSGGTMIEVAFFSDGIYFLREHALGNFFKPAQK